MSAEQPESKRKVRVAVLFGGQSDEHDVSLRSAQTVINALDPEQYEIVKIGITRDGAWLTGGDPHAQLTAASPMFALMTGTEISEAPVGSTGALALPSIFDAGIDVVFPVLHGPMGEDGTIQGMFELMGVPYVGAGVLGSAVGMDKAAAKMILTQAGIAQADWLLVQRGELQRDPAAIEAKIAETLGFPCFVKPANLGSSVGVVKVHNAEELPDALESASHYDRRIVVERGIIGRELEIAVLGNDDPRASVAGEVHPGHEFYDYEAKYLDESSSLTIPAELGPGVLEEMQEMAITAFKALDLAGMARVDFFLEAETNRLLINEVNTIPGFTSISMYPVLWAESGLPLEELVQELLRLGLERFGEKRPTRRRENG
ncbi:D-alanine--D-alanine ligase [soil metagenome]